MHKTADKELKTLKKNNHFSDMQTSANVLAFLLQKQNFKHTESLTQ